MAERFVRNEEVVGSNPIISTRSLLLSWRRVFASFLSLAIATVGLGSVGAEPSVASTPKNSKSKAGNPVIASSTRQLLVGIADDWDSSSVTLQRFVRSTRGWSSVGAVMPGRLGRNGLVWGRGLHPVQASRQKREGDGRTPAGVFAFGDAFGYDPKWESLTKLPYVAVGTRDLFVEDPSSPAYNTHVRLDHEPQTDWERTEQMWQNEPAHRLEVLIEHNRKPVVAGAGSAIFLHIWRGNGSEPTAGCTSVSDANIERVLRWLDPKANPLYVVLPREEYLRVQQGWGLPDAEQLLAE